MLSPALEATESSPCSQLVPHRLVGQEQGSQELLCWHQHFWLQDSPEEAGAQAPGHKQRCHQGPGGRGEQSQHTATAQLTAIS